MAWNFNGSTGKVTYSGAAVSGLPCTLAAFAKPTATTGDNTILGLSNTVDNDPIVRLIKYNNGKLTLDWRDDNTNLVQQAGATTLSTTDWNHCAGTFSLTAGLEVFLNGVSDGTNGLTTNNPTIDITCIAFLRLGGAGDIQFFNGDLAECAMWNVVLTSAEIAALAKGVSPRLIRPQSLAFHVPLVRPLIDLTGKALTTAGTTSVVAHPRVYLPSGAFYSVPVVSGPTQQSISPNGIASVTALGQPTISQALTTQTIEPSGIASTTALGQPTVQPGPVTVSPSGIASISALGQPTVTVGRVVISPNGIDGVSAVGQPTITQPGAAQTISVSGIASVTALGQPTISLAAGRGHRIRRRGRVRRRFPDPAIAAPESRDGLGLPPAPEPRVEPEIDLEPIRARYADVRAAEAAVRRLDQMLEMVRAQITAAVADAATRARAERLQAELAEALIVAEEKRREAEEEDFIIMAA